MLSTIFHIHKKAPAQEDVLAFLTGPEVITLYAANPVEQQQQVFKRTGARGKLSQGELVHI